MTWVALPWFVLTTTGSAAKMGLVMAMELAPMAVLGIPSGAVVDRLGSRRSMILSDGVRAGLMAAVPVLYAGGLLSFPALLALVAGLGVFIAPYLAAQRTILPDLVGEDEAAVSQANALIQGAQRLAMFAGPAVGGVLIAALEPTNVLYVDAATYLVAAALVVAFVPRPARDGASEEVDVSGTLDGVRFLLRDRFFRPLIGGIACGELAFQALFVALPVAVVRVYGGDPRWVGWFLGAFGLGAVLGTMATIPALERIAPFPMAAAALVSTCGLLWLLPLGMPPIGVAGTMFGIGLANPFAQAPLFGVLTVRVPARLRAQVMAASMTLIMLAGPVGLTTGGATLEWYGATPVFTAIAAIVSASYAVVVALVLRDWSRERATTAVRTRDPRVPATAATPASKAHS
jgi:MFS family permease